MKRHTVVCVCARVRMCVRACVRACVHACVCVCVGVLLLHVPTCTVNSNQQTTNVARIEERTKLHSTLRLGRG